MRVFNRIVVILLLAGLFVLGVYAVLYSFDLSGYRMADLPDRLGLSGFYNDLESFVGAVETGGLSPLAIAILVAVFIVGLILLVAELKPRRPRRVRMHNGTYVTRGAVAAEVEESAGRTSNVLEPKVRVKARRRPGAKVNLRAYVRRGEDLRAIRSELREQVEQRLARSGVPLSKFKLRLTESEPRQRKTRVK